MRCIVVLMVGMCLLSGCMSKKVTTVSNVTNDTQSITIKEIPAATRLCDTFTGTKQKVNIGECELYCEIEGKGTPIVLINGGPGDTHHVFHPWMSALSNTFTVVYYDQRGCGLSDYKPMEGYSFDQAVDDLENLRKALNYEKWIVLGFSYGGALAQYYTVKYPESVIGQVLVGAVPMMSTIPLLDRNHEVFSAEELNAFKEIDALFTMRKISMRTRVYNRMLSGYWKRGSYYELPRERMEQAMNYDTLYDPQFASDYRMYNFDHVFETCPIPTLIIEGSEEINWSAQKPVLFKENHKNAEVVVIKKARHFIFSDQPKKMITAIQKWHTNVVAADSNSIQQWKAKTDALLSKQLEPVRQNRRFFTVLYKDGIDSAVKYFDDCKMKRPNEKVFFEESIIATGYHRLASGNVDEALQLFILNIRENPESWNAYDSLAEVYMVKGDKEKAIEMYKKSLVLNPNNENGTMMLKKLEVE